MSDPPSQPSPIAHVSTLAPATAVAFLGDSHVLSGHARFVNIVPLASSSSVKQKRIFTRERIHGIRVSPELGKVVFWGGRRIRVCGSNWLLGAADGDASPEEAPLAPDWVLTVKLLEDGRVLAVGAHNALLVFEPRTETWSQIGCGERTMLYSADLRIELDDGGLVTVVGGTVFGEILVWQWRPELAVGKVWKRLRGHDGSVFSVQLHGTMVASCSDDRTVRLWDLPLVPDELDTAVNTGMGGDEASSDNRNRGNGCIAVGWGHQARPWKIVCLPPKNGEEITLATVSEDLTARFWRIRNDGDKKSLEYFKTFTMHSGKNVWSVDVDPERKLMVTGGNDGRVCLLDYSEEGEDGMTFSLNTVLQSLPDDAMDKEVSTSNKVMKSQRPDNWRNYSFVNARRFVATTEHGRVLLHDLSSSSWTLLGRWDGLRNWGHSAAWEGSGLVALGDSNGYLRIIDVDSKQSWAWEADGVRRKVDGVFVCQADDANDGDDHHASSSTTTTNRVFRVLTSSLPQTLVFHTFTLPHPTTPEESREPQQRQSIHLSIPLQKCIVTSTAYDTASQHLFVGTRTGDLVVYDLSARVLESPLEPARYVRALLHSADAITAIVPGEDKVTMTSRSGIYSVHSLPDLRPLHITKPTPSISQIEGLTSIKSPPASSPSLSSSSAPASASQFIYGFRALNFVTHSLSLGIDTLTVPCGGAHRSWSFHARSQTLLWTQSGTLHLFSRSRQRESPIRVLLPGLHGREIKAAAYNSKYGVLATGAEDTTIRLSTPVLSCDDEQQGKEKVQTGGWRQSLNGLIKHHSTGLMGLAWTPDGKRLISVAGMEEVFVWRVVVDRQKGEVGVVMEAELEPPGEREVRIMAVDVQEWDGGLVVGVVTSDGLVRLLRYTMPSTADGGVEEGGRFDVLQEWTYGAICITQIALLAAPPSSSSGSNSGIFVIAAATDGCVFAYHHQSLAIASTDTSTASISSAPSLPVWRERVHQNTVKSLTLIPPSSSSSSSDSGSTATDPNPRFHILSGGDDGSISSLTIVIATSTSTPTLTTHDVHTIEETHAGAVIGIASSLRGNTGKVVSVGSEGRIKLWSPLDTAARAGAKIVPVGMVDCGVADPGDVVVLWDGDGDKNGEGVGKMRVVICGVGIEVWDFL